MLRGWNREMRCGYLRPSKLGMGYCRGTQVSNVPRASYLSPSEDDLGEKTGAL